MRCFDCKADLGIGDKFCRNCGTAITPRKVESFAGVEDAETSPRLPNASAGHTTRVAQPHEQEGAAGGGHAPSESGPADTGSHRRAQRRAGRTSPAQGGAPAWRWGVLFVVCHALSMAVAVALVIVLAPRQSPQVSSTAPSTPAPSAATAPAPDVAAETAAANAQIAILKELAESQKDLKELVESQKDLKADVRRLGIIVQPVKAERDAGGTQKAPPESKPVKKATSTGTGRKATAIAGNVRNNPEPKQGQRGRGARSLPRRQTNSRDEKAERRASERGVRGKSATH